MILSLNPKRTGLPPTSHNRIQVVDALRGVALFGILLVHSANWFDGGTLPQRVYQILPDRPVDVWVRIAINFFCAGKFYTLFSFLFGLSFALMLTRNKLPKIVFLRRFCWRLVILGGIGFLHQLHWRGDILIIYALLGFVLLFFQKAPLRVVLGFACLLVLNFPGRVRDTYYHLYATPKKESFFKTEQKQEVNRRETVYNILLKGTYMEVVQSNIQDFPHKMDYQLYGGRLSVTLGFFMLGLYAGRKQYFQFLYRYQSLARRLLRYTSFLLVAVVILYASLLVTSRIYTVPVLLSSQLFPILTDTAKAGLTVMYIIGFTLLFYRNNHTRFVAQLSAVGQMALTNYILQSIVGAFIFYGYGLGLMSKFGVALATSLAVPLFIFQLISSEKWLAYFKYGPLEWVWRSLTYLKLQPMRKKKSTDKEKCQYSFEVPQ